jgi:hypothetical protein
LFVLLIGSSEHHLMNILRLRVLSYLCTLM